MASVLDMSILESLRTAEKPADPSKSAIQRDIKKADTDSAVSTKTALDASNEPIDKNKQKALDMAEALVQNMKHDIDLENVVEELVATLGYSLKNEVLANDLLNAYYRNYANYYKHRLHQLQKGIVEKKLKAETLLYSFNENVNIRQLIEGKEIHKVINILLLNKDELKHKKVKGGYVSNLTRLKEIVADIESMEAEAGHIADILESKKEEAPATQPASVEYAELKKAINTCNTVQQKAHKLEVVVDTIENQTATLYALKTLYRAKYKEMIQAEGSPANELESARKSKLASIYAGIDAEAEKLITLILEAENERQKGINVKLVNGVLQKEEY